MRDFLARHDGFAVLPPAEVAQALGGHADGFANAARLSDTGITMTPRTTDTDGFFVSVLRRA